MSDVDVNKGLEQIKMPILLYSCTPFSELPSNISTMIQHLLCTALRWIEIKVCIHWLITYTSIPHRIIFWDGEITSFCESGTQPWRRLAGGQCHVRRCYIDDHAGRAVEGYSSLFLITLLHSGGFDTYSVAGWVGVGYVILMTEVAE